MKRIILRESQTESLKNKLMDIINDVGFEMAVRIAGSFKKLVNIIGKDNLYDILVDHKFDPNKIEMVTSKYDIPSSFYGISSFMVEYLNNYGPMYLLTINGEYHMFQPRSNKNLWIGPMGTSPEEYYLEKFGLGGLDVNKVIDLYFVEE
jgi:hypothetical protein